MVSELIFMKSPGLDTSIGSEAGHIKQPDIPLSIHCKQGAGWFCLRGKSGFRRRCHIPHWLVRSLAEEFFSICASKHLPAQAGRIQPVLVNQHVGRALKKLGANPGPRVKDGKPYGTDNGCRILDAAGLEIRDPNGLEKQINQLAGVTSVGLFAMQGAAVCLLGTSNCVKILQF